jgi:hypothetical protein
VALCHERAVGVQGKPEGPVTPEQEKAFTEANTLFVGAVIYTLVDHL